MLFGLLSDMTVLSDSSCRVLVSIGKESLKKAVQENDTIVILGETGSGKTTRESCIPAISLASD